MNPITRSELYDKFEQKLIPPELYRGREGNLSRTQNEIGGILAISLVFATVVMILATRGAFQNMGIPSNLQMFKVLWIPLTALSAGVVLVLGSLLVMVTLIKHYYLNEQLTPAMVKEIKEDIEKKLKSKAGEIEQFVKDSRATADYWDLELQKVGLNLKSLDRGN